MYTPTVESSLLKCLSEMIAACHHLATTVEIQEDYPMLENFPELPYLLSRIRALTEEHLEELQQVLRHHGGDEPSTLKSAVHVMAETAMVMANKLKPHTASGILRENYVSLNAIAIGYETVYATALAFDCINVADMSLLHLRNNTLLIREIGEAILPVVVAELAEEYEVNQGAFAGAYLNIKRTWESA